MTINTAPQQYRKAVAAVRNVAVSFASKLDPGEALTGTPSLAVTPSGLSVDNEAVSTVLLTINGVSTAIGAAVQFRASGGDPGVKYTIAITCQTDSVPAQTLLGNVELIVVA